MAVLVALGTLLTFCARSVNADGACTFELSRTDMWLPALPAGIGKKKGHKRLSASMEPWETADATWGILL